MSELWNPQYSPYGAYELKAKYRRNMLISCGITLGVTLTCLMIIWYLFPSGGGAIVPDDEPGTIRIDTTSFVLEEPPIIEWEKPVKSAHKPPESITTTGHLVPVKVLEDPPSEVSDEPNEYGYMPDSGNGDGPETYGRDEGTGKMEIGEPIVPGFQEYVYVEQPPEMIREATPVYPQFAKATGQAGEVHLRVLVGIDGKVIEPRIEISSGYELLDRAALDAATLNRFTPGIQNGRPVLVWVSYTVEFVLSE